MATAQPIKWHGGKRYLAKWILEHFPSRSSYTHYLEPFAGGLSVLFAHDPDGISESANDLNGQLSNFWQVLRDENLFSKFEREIQATEFSDQRFLASRNKCIDENSISNLSVVEQACAFFIRYRMSRQGLGRDFATPTRRTRRGMNENVSAWLSAVDSLPEAHSRLRRVEIRNMNALAFIQKYDHPRAIFYLDPPYLHETRVTTKDYDFEMGVKDHTDLLSCLSDLKGKFIISGYPSDLYDGHARRLGWRKVERQIDNKASGKKTKDKKTECLWMNYGKA